MSQVKCLTCKYAPEWTLPTGGDTPRSTGKCRKPISIPDIPAVYLVQERWAEVYSDGSGFPTQCKAWEPSIEVYFESDAGFITVADKGRVLVRCRFEDTDCGDLEHLDNFVARHGGVNKITAYLLERCK